MPRGFLPNLSVAGDLVGGGVDHRDRRASLRWERRRSARRKPRQRERGHGEGARSDGAERSTIVSTLGMRRYALCLQRAVICTTLYPCSHRHMPSGAAPATNDACTRPPLIARAPRFAARCWRVVILRGVAAGRRAPQRTRACVARSGGRHGDAQRRARFDLPASIDTRRRRDRSSGGQLQVNLSESLVRVPGIFVRTAGTTRRTCSCRSAASARARSSACAACGSTRTTSRRRCPTGRARPAASACCRRSGSRCCAGRSRRCTAMPSGGVISVFTEDGPTPPQASAQAIGGSYGTWNAVAKVGGQAGARRLRRRRQPLRDRRLSRSQRRARAISSTPSSRSMRGARHARHGDRQFAVPAGGAGPARPHARAVGGRSAAGRPGGDRCSTRARPSTSCRAASTRRADASPTTPMLRVDRLRRHARRSGSTSRCPATAPTSSGGVTDLDRDFGGVDARLDRRGSTLAGGPLTLTVGADYEPQQRGAAGLRQQQRRLWATLRRDEDDTVSNSRRLRCRSSGRRSRAVAARRRPLQRGALRVDDHYIVAGNPDDSGPRNYTHTSPVLGAVWHATDDAQRLRELRRRASRRRRSPSSRTARSAPASTSRCSRRSATSVRDRRQGAASARSIGSTCAAFAIDTDRRDRHRHGHRRPHDVQERRARRGAAASRLRGTASCGAGFTAYASLHVPVGASSRRTPTTGVAAGARSGGRAAAGRPGSRGLRRAHVVAPAAGTGFNAGGRGRSTSARSTSTTATPTARRPTRSATCASASRSASGTLDAARIRARQQHHQPQLRRIGDRRRHQRPLLRAGARRATSSSASASMSASDRSATRAPRSRCTG